MDHSQYCKFPRSLSRQIKSLTDKKSQIMNVTYDVSSSLLFLPKGEKEKDKKGKRTENKSSFEMNVLDYSCRISTSLEYVWILNLCFTFHTKQSHHEAKMALKKLSTGTLNNNWLSFSTFPHHTFQIGFSSVITFNQIHFHTTSSISIFRQQWLL